MAKKRNCRRSDKERSDHEKAVMLRKMPDCQLVEYMERQYRTGFDTGQISVETAEQEVADRILEAVSTVKGVGASTLAKIQAAIEGSAELRKEMAG